MWGVSISLHADYPNIGPGTPLNIGVEYPTLTYIHLHGFSSILPRYSVRSDYGMDLALDFARGPVELW